MTQGGLHSRLTTLPQATLLSKPARRIRSA